MDTAEVPFSRIDKLFLDRDETDPTTARVRRQQHAVVLHCGNDAAYSYTLQLAVLTAANLAGRCFPGSVRVALDPIAAEAPLLVWPSLKQSFGAALTALIGPGALVLSGSPPQGRVVIFGDVPVSKGALRVTFDGWIAKIGPTTEMARLPEREYCSLAGILGAALAISELFLAFADISIEAGRRALAVSLWRPDADVSAPDALGVLVQFLPRDLWVLGLGHLGNAYLWTLASLPYADTREVELFLNDFDKIEDENVETSMLLSHDRVRWYKTRACSAWLEQRGFGTRLIERRFDEDFRRRNDEPGLALCGFDSNPARRHLATARFSHVVESGLGGTANNFDTINLHTYPNPRHIEELWPDLDPAEETRRREYQERVSKENGAYARLGRDACGRYELAGKSIAVPFVGATASTFVIAEVLRLLHRGPAVTGVKLRMASLEARLAQSAGNYSVQDLAGLKYCTTR